MISRTKLQEALTAEATNTGQADFPHDDKSTTNILRLADKCGLWVPQQHSASIIGLQRTLPTRQAVPPLFKMLGEKLANTSWAPLKAQQKGAGRTHAHRSVRTLLTVSLDERPGMSGRLVLGIWTS